jgi:hypothetical protein
MMTRPKYWCIANCIVMDRDLIIKALKSSCGNKNFRFQVIVHKSKLHIYINRKVDHLPDYVLLTNNITQAIANLSLESLEGVWIYSRQLGEIQPDWQTFVESPVMVDQEEIVTLGNILEDTQLSNDKPLPAEEIATFSNDRRINASEAKSEAKINDLTQYCFVSNKNILTEDILPPNREVIRLVRFFAHLSVNNQQKILPIVDEYFKKAQTSNTENLAIAVNKWFQQITELQYDDQRSLAIWLSRYCFNSSATLAEFKSMEAKVALKTAKKRVKRNQIAYGFSPVNSEIAAPKKQFSDATTTRFQRPSSFNKLIILIVWTLATVMLISLGVYTNQPITHYTSSEIAALCETTIGSSNYCHLGVDLAGKDLVKQSAGNIFPLSKITETAAKFGCERFANVKAGAINNLDPKKNPVISSHGEKIFPDVYVVEAIQKDLNQGQNIRVGCVYTTGESERSPKKLASDLIPLNWPTQHYQRKAVIRSINLPVYLNLIDLGLYILFSAVGITIASEFELGIAIANQTQIYLIALILGIVQLIASNLPGLNLLASIIFSVLAIVITSHFLKSFQLNLSDGYPLVAVGILTIIITQFLLYGICWQLINSLIYLIIQK